MDAENLATGHCSGTRGSFAAIALADVQPEQALQDVRTLLRQRSWVNREDARRANRLVCLGDLLMRLGRTEEAIRAYELANEGTSSPAKERLAVAVLYHQIQDAAAPQLLTAAASERRNWPPRARGLRC